MDPVHRHGRRVGGPGHGVASSVVAGEGESLRNAGLALVTASVLALVALMAAARADRRREF